MQNLAALPQVRSTPAQLPAAWYLDPRIFAREKQLLFDAGPGYVGHELMAPEPGDYHTLAWMDHARVLVRNASGVELLSNVCRHRQSIMLEGRGSVRNIVCPVHRWTYDLKGELLGAPLFEEAPCVRLESTPLARWNGLLFAGPRDARRDLAGMLRGADFDFSGYRLDRMQIDDYACNWKTFIEVYLEVYHVDFYHPGLGNFTDCNNFYVEYGERHSVQVVSAKKGLTAPGTPAYRRWQEACLARLAGATPNYGALWATYYPGVMLEWYPNVLVVSSLIPRSPELTTNVVEFYYPEEIVHFEREFVEAQQAAYAETAREDDEICRRMDRGRKALWLQGREDAGPYQSPMEDAMRHFHEWVRRELGAT
ncbi:MAG TPA: aromatic ring-hydroxylating dioxygenase subunit alpha [Burkholderiales bacterium]|nr:aromatic ring-hydroxylating dioxygenase subunit alpha [Burkholderiales bacterium]